MGILSYLWGIETFPDGSCLIVGDDFILPMRNWNTGFKAMFGIHSPGFYLTYEELKHITGENNFQFLIWFYLTYEELKLRNYGKASFERLRFYLTYEELKLAWTKYAGMSKPDFILPMRNWNGTNVIPVCICSQGFYLTYEELKQGVSNAKIAALKGFYLTYEELKLRSITEGENKAIRGFYLTYEELKLGQGAQWIYDNWGFYLTYEELKQGFTTRQLVEELWILSYLWGIETRQIYVRRLVQVRILSYLWGIETRTMKP